jgi:hypothetical protein
MLASSQQSWDPIASLCEHFALNKHFALCICTVPLVVLKGCWLLEREEHCAYAFRNTMVKWGTVNRALATNNLLVYLTNPVRSAATPTINPGVSHNERTGIRNVSPLVFGPNLQCQPVRGMNTREECQWSHACQRFKRSKGACSSITILECRFLSKKRTPYTS